MRISELLKIQRAKSHKNTRDVSETHEQSQRKPLPENNNGEKISLNLLFASPSEVKSELEQKAWQVASETAAKFKAEHSGQLDPKIQAEHQPQNENEFGIIIEHRKKLEQQEEEHAKAFLRLEREFEKKLQDKSETISKLKQEIERKYQTQIQDDKSKIEAEAKEVIGRVKAQMQENAQAYNKTIAKIQAQAEQKAQEYAEIIAGIKYESETKIAEKNARIAQLEAKAKEKEETLKQAFAKIKSQSTQTITNQAAQIEQLKKELKDKSIAYEKTVVKIKTELEEKSRALAEAKEKLRSREKDRHRARANELDGRLLEQCIRAKTDAEFELQEKSKAYEDAIAKLKAEMDEKTTTYKKAFSKIKREIKETIAKIEEDAAEKVKSLAKQLAKVQSESQEKAKEHIKELEKTRQATENTKLRIMAEAEAKISLAEKQASEAIAKMRNETTEKDSMQQLAKVRNEFQQRERSYKQKIEQLNSKLEELSKNHDAELARLRVSSQEKAKRQADKIAELNKEVERNIKNFTIMLEKTKAEYREKTETKNNAIVESSFKSQTAQQESKNPTKAKARAEELNARLLEQCMMAKDEAESEIKQKERIYAQEVSKVKAEAENKLRSYEQNMAKVKAQAKDTIAKIRADAQKKTASYAEAIKTAMEKAKVKSKDKFDITKQKHSYESPDKFFSICAKDIMDKKVIWAGADEVVQQILKKMETHGVEYVLIGKEQVPEGIVSKSDVTGAISPYLRPSFSKWRRPLDEATLQIKVKWIMSRPVHTISPQTPLGNIIDDMQKHNCRCLPVRGQNGQIEGLVTTFSLFKVKTLLNPEEKSNISSQTVAV